ncbi:MAG: 16S rRNA methyltransferase [Candidatus Thermoplasmatota archaeon]|nr:16S rRNA methyltransferase [Candidatus Thermoplasmatota archaeon]
MLTLVLAEAELELIPPEVQNHPAILKYARQRGKPPARLLLDSNYHHAAMTHLPEGRRRGRPDITHLFLLTALESIVNRQGDLTTLIHTRNQEVIAVHPETRIMRNDERFQGLMEQLFEHHRVPKKDHPLLCLTPQMSLTDIITSTHADTVLVFSTTGTPVLLAEYFQQLREQKHSNILCVIGGFPSGTFHADLAGHSTATLSVYPEMLPAWTIANELVVNYENAWR